eukprot:4504461-Alexandrium_andersonii.AAC.1
MPALPRRSAMRQQASTTSPTCTTAAPRGAALEIGAGRRPKICTSSCTKPPTHLCGSCTSHGAWAGTSALGRRCCSCRAAPGWTMP